MATHSSILAWRTAWTEEPGGLYSPWGRKESDTTERLRVHTQQRREEMMVLWARVLSKGQRERSECMSFQLP